MPIWSFELSVIPVVIPPAGRSTGRLPVPDACAPLPSALQGQCELCGGCYWQADAEPAPPVTVFLPSAVVTTTFPVYVCGNPDGCAGRLQADGGEPPYMIMRYDSKYAFAHEVFYQWADRLMVGGVTFFSFWRDLLLKCKGYVMSANLLRLC